MQRAWGLWLDCAKTWWHKVEESSPRCTFSITKQQIFEDYADQIPTNAAHGGGESLQSKICAATGEVGRGLSFRRENDAGVAEREAISSGRAALRLGKRSPCCSKRRSPPATFRASLTRPSASHSMTGRPKRTRRILSPDHILSNWRSIFSQWECRRRFSWSEDKCRSFPK